MATKMRGQLGAETEAAAFGFYRSHVDGQPNSRWSIACSECGDVSSHGWAINTSPAKMVKTMRSAGWDVTRRGKRICPSCQKKERTSVKQQIGPDPKIARKIYALLDEHFDEVKRLYRAGWNDQKIADTIDTSVEVVIRLRRDAYAELAEDPVFQVLRDELAQQRKDAADLQTMFMTELSALLDKVAKTEQRLADACGAHHKAAG